MTALEALMEALLDPADCWMTSGGTDGIWCGEHDAPRAVTDPKVCQDRLQHDAAMADLARKATAVGDITIQRNRLRDACAALMDHAVEVGLANDAVVYAMQFDDMEAARSAIAAALEQDG